MNTVVGIYRTVDEARKAESTLKDQGFDSDDLKVIDQSEEHGSEESMGQKIKNFFSFSENDDQANADYTDHVTRGGALLAVRVDQKDTARISDMLYAGGATDIKADRGNSGSGNLGSSYAGTDAKSAGYSTEDIGGRSIPVVQEDLVVGKREVNRGGVRVHTHTVTEPVSANVSLHEERIVLDRRPVDREATDADFGDDRVVELTATGEEAVVGKTSRVIEEVHVGKQATDRTEQINDTVRHTEVEVEEFAGTDDSKKIR